MPFLLYAKLPTIFGSASHAQNIFIIKKIFLLLTSKPNSRVKLSSNEKRTKNITVMDQNQTQKAADPFFT